MKTILKLLILVMSSFSIGMGQSVGDSTEILAKAKKDVELLCSEGLAGRGYIDEGHKKAASFIASRFEEMGLSPFDNPIKATNPYFQNFIIDINLASKLEISINGKQVEVGKEAIVNKFSGSGQVSGKVIDMGHGLEPTDKVKGKIALIRAGWPKKLDTKEKRKEFEQLSKTVDRIAALIKNGATGIIIKQEKLTAGFTREQAPIPVVEVLNSAMPKKIKTADIKLKSEMTRLQSQNVIAVIEGKSKTKEAIIVSAHYDHLGKLENAIFTGANDNASGTSMLLSIAEYFQANPLDYKLIFIAFGGEETGLVGSNFYANQNPLFPLASTKFILNLDLMGNGIKGITAVGGKDYAEQFDLLKQINEKLDAVPVVRARPNAPNSDHFFFLKQGVPGFFIYTLGGPPHYHDVNDRPENMEYSRYINVRELMIRFLEAL
ncbi:MAG: M28 family peptidase [Bacteroidia bacterium]|nr:M28 family peptidase [Bacteroidia bacterium]